MNSFLTDLTLQPESHVQKFALELQKVLLQLKLSIGPENQKVQQLDQASYKLYAIANTVNTALNDLQAKFNNLLKQFQSLLQSVKGDQRTIIQVAQDRMRLLQQVEIGNRQRSQLVQQLDKTNLLLQKFKEINDHLKKKNQLNDRKCQLYEQSMSKERQTAALEIEQTKECLDHFQQIYTDLFQSNKKIVQDYIDLVNSNADTTEAFQRLKIEFKQLQRVVKAQHLGLLGQPILDSEKLQLLDYYGYQCEMRKYIQLLK